MKNILSNYDNFNNRTIFITGASGYIGKKTSLFFASIGANLILVDKKNIDYEKQLKEQKCKFDFKKVNLEKQMSRFQLYEWIKYKKISFDTLINNAAFVGTDKIKGWNVNFENQSIETWRKVFELNLTSTFEICQKFEPILNSHKNASIINISSIYDTMAPNMYLYKNTGIKNQAAYSISKNGILHLTKWLAATCAPNIRVNSISPGGIVRNQNLNFKKKYIKKTLLNRMATEEDVVASIFFLSSNLSSYITGQNIKVDGGFGLS